jgi:phage tail protein X
MESEYRCKDGDVLDLICYRFYGEAPVKAGIVEYVLNFNQNLSRLPIVLTAGLMIQLPPLPPELAIAPTQKIKIFENG